MRHAVRGRVRSEARPIASGRIQPLAPERFVDRTLAPRQHAQRYRRGRTPQRHPDQSPTLVHHAHHPRPGGWRFQHVAAVDPGVLTARPARGAPAAHDRLFHALHAGTRCAAPAPGGGLTRECKSLVSMAKAKTGARANGHRRAVDDASPCR